AVPGPGPAVVGRLRDRRRGRLVEVLGQVLHGQVDRVADAEHPGRLAVESVRVPDRAELVRPGDRPAGQVGRPAGHLVHHDVTGGDVQAEAAAVPVGGVQLVVGRPAGRPEITVALGHQRAAAVDLDRAVVVAGRRGGGRLRGGLRSGPDDHHRYGEGEQGGGGGQGRSHGRLRSTAV